MGQKTSPHPSPAAATRRAHLARSAAPPSPAARRLNRCTSSTHSKCYTSAPPEPLV
ncbi:unnamed protein product [Rhodiola kirilowii]